MAKLMKAAAVRQFCRPLNIEEVRIPAPGPGEVLVKVMARGVCHTDLHAADGDWPVKPAPPFIPGHEGTGIVAAAGAGVRTLKERDPVGIAGLHDACCCSEHCITGRETLCETRHDSGYGANSSFAEYAIGSATYVARLPAKGNGQPGRAAAGRFCHPDLRCGSQADRVARIDRWYGQGFGRSRRVRQRGQNEGPYSPAITGGYQ